MPTYDYECAHCGAMEVFQSMREDALTECPKCGSKHFTKQVSAGAGVIFKGEGFWETDYNRSADYKKASSGETGSSGSNDSSSSTSSSDN